MPFTSAQQMCHVHVKCHPGARRRDSSLQLRDTARIGEALGRQHLGWTLQEGKWGPQGGFQSPLWGETTQVCSGMRQVMTFDSSKGSPVEGG